MDDDTPSTTGDGPPPRRPDGASDELVEAVGKLSEAVEHVERARGHLYSFHQLMGHADLQVGEAADMLEECGKGDDAERLRTRIVGRNVLEGRWTFQIVEEFDDGYHAEVVRELRRLEGEHMGGLRHVFESEMKESRRTKGAEGHESRPANRT